MMQTHHGHLQISEDGERLKTEKQHDIKGKGKLAQVENHHEDGSDEDQSKGDGIFGQRRDQKDQAEPATCSQTSASTMLHVKHHDDTSHTLMGGRGEAKPGRAKRWARKRDQAATAPEGKKCCGLQSSPSNGR